MKCCPRGGLNKLVTAAVSIGSNVGDRLSHVDFACARLSGFLQDLRVSSVYETSPVDAPGPQGDFLNLAAVGRTDRPAREVLSFLLEVEQERGRLRPFVHAPRTLDLDLILFGDAVVHEPGLIVPHPGFRDRRFVLEPLASIAPELKDPVTGKTVAELLVDLDD